MFRPVQPALRAATNADGPAVLALVTTVLAEYGLQPDPSGLDADLAHLERHYFARGGDFVVLTDATGAIVGSCGLYPLLDGTVELRKMYLARALRRHGQGRRLLEWALTRARALGFRRLTLETASVLKEAIAFYELNGFHRDPAGHPSGRCDVTFWREL